ncbi:MAG: precorrin-6Y C5,15-methyltransferase (decarboxylating) subunit CbiT [Halobacteriota archaeon]
MLKGGPTKPEIIAIALEKLRLQNDETFADIGCGTGSVSIAAAKRTKKIIAVDKRRKSIEVAQQNFELAGVLDAVTLVWGEAPDILVQYKDSIDKAFIGGTTNFKEIIEFLIPRCSRLVLNAARLELAAEVIWYMKDLGIYDEVLLINIAKGYALEGLTGFESHNPVFMVVGTC